MGTVIDLVTVSLAVWLAWRVWCVERVLKGLPLVSFPSQDRERLADFNAKLAIVKQGRALLRERLAARANAGGS